MRKLYQLKRERLFSTVLFMVMIPLVMIGCFPDDSHFDVNPDLAGRLFPQIQAEPEFSTHAKAIEMSGMESFIGRAGLYTVYVPTNDAWQDFFDNHPTYNSLEDIPEETLQRIVFYHAMVNMYFTFDYEDGMERFFALGGKYLTAIKDDNGNITIDSTSIDDQLFNINAENGAIHGLNSVLIPKPNFSEFAINHQNGIYSRYYTLLEDFTRREVNEDLSTPDQIVIDTISELGIDFRNEDQLATGFIFTDEAFNNWLATQPQFPTLEDVYEEVLLRIMNHHFIESDPEGNFAYVLGELLNTPIEAVSGEMVTLSPEDVANGYIAISNGNGIAVKNLLIPPSFSTLAGYTLLNPDQNMQIFYRAMEKAGLYNTFGNPSGSYTIFAPTDDAFKAAGIDTTTVKEMSGTELQALLQYHSLNSEIAQSDLPAEKYLTNIQGSSILIRSTDLTGTESSTASITSSISRNNGILYTINDVLIPPSESAYDVLDNDVSSRFTILLDAAELTGNTGTLQAGGYTIFAPTDAAWQAFFDTRPDILDLNNFSDKTSELDSILRLHIIPNTRIFSLEANNGDVLNTLLTIDTEEVTDTAKVTLNIIGSDIFVIDNNASTLDAKVITKDEQGTNGLVHIINRVLLPE